MSGGLIFAIVMLSVMISSLVAGCITWKQRHDFNGGAAIGFVVGLCLVVLAGVIISIWFLCSI